MMIRPCSLPRVEPILHLDISDCFVSSFSLCLKHGDVDALITFLHLICRFRVASTVVSAGQYSLVRNLVLHA